MSGPITTRVLLDGVEVPAEGEALKTGQATVVGGPSFTWGRSTIVDQPDASTLSLTIEQRIVDGSGFPSLFDFLTEGSVVQVRSATVDRDVLVWAGEIVSAKIQHVAANLLAAQVTCTDGSAILSNINIGDDPWPEESAYNRFLNILDAAGVRIKGLRPNLDSGTDPWVWELTGEMDDTIRNTQIAARDVDKQPPLDLIKNLADSVGGIAWITADATGPYIWIEDPTQRKALRQFFIDPITGQVSVGPLDITLLPTPPWSAKDVLRGPIGWEQDPAQSVNVTDVNWQQPAGTNDQGNPAYEQQTVEVADSTSTKGIRSLTIDTQVVDDWDARRLAVHWLAQAQSAKWITTGLTIDTIVLNSSPDPATDVRLPVVMDLLDARARIGYRLTVPDMPAYSPAGIVQSFYVEGGTYTWSGSRWQLQLNASSAAIGGGATFNDFPAGVTMSDFANLEGRDMWGAAPPSLSAAVIGASLPMRIRSN